MRTETNHQILVDLIKLYDELQKRGRLLENALNAQDIDLIFNLDDIILDYVGFPVEGYGGQGVDAPQPFDPKQYGFCRDGYHEIIWEGGSTPEDRALQLITALTEYREVHNV